MKEIEVEKVEHKEANVEEKTGMIEWKLNLEPNKEKKYSFKYKVKYPKDKNLSLE
jgi:hypothetical protein